MKKVKTFLLVVIVIALCAVFVGFLVTYVNPKTKQIARFCLRYDGQTITDTANVTFPREVVTVQAKHVFEFAESDTSFSVKIVPNPQADFKFRVGNSIYSFSAVEDLTPAFHVEIAKDGFTVDLTEIKKPQKVLEELFLGSVVLPQEIERDYYYRLEVTSAVGKTVTINFNTDPVPVERVEIAPDNEEVFYF